MLSRKFRFHGYGSLKRAYQHGRTIRGQMVSLRFLERQPGGSCRVAVVVSKKVHKSAIVRNRIRRRVYEQVRLAGQLPEADLVFTVFSDQVATMETLQLSKIVDDLLKKAANTSVKSV